MFVRGRVVLQLGSVKRRQGKPPNNIVEMSFAVSIFVFPPRLLNHPLVPIVTDVSPDVLLVPEVFVPLVIHNS